MKIKCLRGNLKSGLDTVGQAVPGKATLPVLGSVLLSAGEKGILTLTASNLEQSITLPIGGKCETEGAIAIPYRLLSSVITELPEDSLVELSLDKRLLELVTESSLAHISCQDSKDFPPIPNCSGGQVIIIPASELKQAIDLTVFGVATEQNRPILCGVNVHAVGDKLRFASADGFRLAVYASDTITDSMSIIFPDRTMSIVSKLCRAVMNGDSDPDITIQLGKPDRDGDIHTASFTIGKAVLVSQLISGTFPDYDKIIPTDFKTTATIGLDDFLRAARLAGITARGQSGILRLEIDGDKMTVSGGKGSETGDIVTSLPVSLEGEQPAKIALDYRYLTEVLTVFRGLSVSGVTFAIVSGTQPCVVRPVGIDGYTYVVMPVYVDWEQESR